MGRILIADCDGAWRAELERELEQVHLLRSCSDGRQAAELAARFQPDVLILDLLLPGADGLSVLKTLQRMPEMPRVIVTGRYFSEFITGALNHYRVDSILLKPCAVRTVVERVEELLVPELLPVTPAPCDRITALLLRLGIRNSRQGFRFLRAGVLLLLSDPTQQLTKSLYPAIAKEFGSTAVNVEKALRTAVTLAWSSRREEVWRVYFPPAPNGQIPRPTAGQFLRRLADVTEAATRGHG